MAYDDFGEPAGGDRGWAALAHGGVPVVSLLPALLVLGARGKHSRFVRAHALEAANFQLTLVLGLVLSAILMATLTGPVVAVVVVVGGLVLGLAGLARAAQGAPWRYPLSLRVLRAQPVPGGPPDDARVVLGTAREGTRVATGASSPGDDGYEGRVTVGDEGGAEA